MRSIKILILCACLLTKISAYSWEDHPDIDDHEHELHMLKIVKNLTVDQQALCVKFLNEDEERKEIKLYYESHPKKKVLHEGK